MPRLASPGLNQAHNQRNESTEGTRSPGSTANISSQSAKRVTVPRGSSSSPPQSPLKQAPDTIASCDCSHCEKSSPPPSGQRDRERASPSRSPSNSSRTPSSPPQIPTDATAAPTKPTATRSQPSSNSASSSPAATTSTTACTGAHESSKSSTDEPPNDKRRPPSSAPRACPEEQRAGVRAVMRVTVYVLPHHAASRHSLQG